jgi:hypothetical protein
MSDRGAGTGTIRVEISLIDDGAVTITALEIPLKKFAEMHGSQGVLASTLAHWVKVKVVEVMKP